MNLAPDSVFEIFNEALKLAPRERTTYLEQACSGEEKLLQRVENLLAAHERAGGFLDLAVSVVSGSVAAPLIGERPGDRVGNYKLTEQIGEGGCGVVFLAEQQEPVRRQVALKVVKPGMDTRSVIAQFESERQALAMMAHPNIAQVLDAGATEAGRPFFVMELVRGTKITDYCNQHEMTVTARLELFAQVCHAIQHAHQKGVIHRDIKPSNILVSTTGEGGPLPKVIDFGIAKATTGQQLTDRTFFTAFEMLVGTPAYMSPEQADLKVADVDTRADIYSLGVLLHELLTGAPPFDIREISKVGLDEVRRDILEKKPVRPSLCLRVMSPADLAIAARQRQAETSRLIRCVNGDLDWIVMKALEKDRSRRYPTANALALDVQRHLANETVSARPPGTFYQISKLVARNRLMVGSLAVFVVLLTGSLAVVSVTLAGERKAHELADAEKYKASVEAERNKKANDVLSHMLSSVSSGAAEGRDTSMLREMFNEADKRIRENLADQPEVELKLRKLLASSYTGISDFGAAERMLRRAQDICQKATPPDLAMVAWTETQLGYLLVLKADYPGAESQLLSARENWRKLGGSEAENGDAKAMQFLSIVRSRQGRNEEAEALMQRAFEWTEKHYRPDQRDYLNALTTLALVHHGSKKYAESERRHREVVELMRRQYGEQSPIQLQVLMNLVKTSSAQGKKDEEKRFLSEAVAIYRKRYHPENAARLEATLYLADLYRKEANFAQAEPLYREVIENSSNTSSSGKSKPTSANASAGLVKMLLGKKMGREAEDLLNQILTPKFMESPESIPLLETRAGFLSRAGRWREAAADATRLVEMQPDMHEHYHRLAPLLVAAGQHEAYRRLCPEILYRFGTTVDARIADRMAKDCLILPDALENLEAVGHMASIAVEGGAKDPALPFFQACKALADYRQGNFAAAAELAGLVGEISYKEAEVEARAVEAMALHRMNRTDEAKILLERGAATFATKLSKLESGEIRGNWEDWVIARALLEEARELIEGGKQ